MPTIRPCRPDERPALLRIINLAAEKYRGVIPVDRWHEPYMTDDDLAADIAAGVEMWGAEQDGVLVGVMGTQRVSDATLIRHAYVLPALQGAGIGGQLLRELCARTSGLVLIGTWAAASWAIAFYTHHGFALVPGDDARTLLARYWTIPDRQIETSVVLRRVLDIPGGGDHLE